MAAQQKSSNSLDLTQSPSSLNAEQLKKSPIPPDSPLLRPSTPSSPGSRRAREIQREARKARNFRASLDRSGSRSRGATPIASPPPAITGTELSFSIKPSTGGRKGWKIMPETGDPDPAILQRVIDMIHEIEFSGRAVPERITLKV